MKKGLFFIVTLAFLFLILNAFDHPFKTDSGEKIYAQWSGNNNQGDDDNQGDDNDQGGGGHGVPEPSLLILLGSGLAGIGAYAYFQYKKGSKSKR